MINRTLTHEEKFCLEGCSTYAQYYEMRRQFESGVCPFCVVNSSINKTLFDNEHWLVWENAFSAGEHCKHMFVIVAKRHIRILPNVTPAGWMALDEALSWLHAMYRLPGGMLFLRFGDMCFNAGTVPHLHFNLWVPDGSGEVRIPLYKTPEQREKNRVRALTFAEHYRSNLVPE